MSGPERVNLSSPSLGVRVDGHDPGIRFATVSDARRSAELLVTHGYRDVAVFDRVTGQTLPASAMAALLRNRST